MKFLILLCYFERPILVRNALKSILKSNEHHQDWELVFGDDGSLHEGQPIVEDILRDHLHKVRFVNSRMSLEEKLSQGIQLGKYANEEILRSRADVAVTLSDDDELVPTYLRDLGLFLESNPQKMYCYSKIHIYNPLLQSSENVNNPSGSFNVWDGPIDPVNKVDASQVAFRLDCFRNNNIRYPNTTHEGDRPWVKNFDSALFEQLYQQFGECVYTGLIGQYKGIHDYQLVWHKKSGVSGLTKYMKEVRELAGTIL